MKKFFCLLSFVFLISIKKINSNNDDYISCKDGFYGLNCNQTCNCKVYSSSNICSKTEGRCLDCKFGHFGMNCSEHCFPKCKTNLCCAIKSTDFKESENSLTSNLSKLKVIINKIELNIEIDFNVGYPLTIFNNKIKPGDIPNSKKGDDREYTFTNYFIKGPEYDDASITIKDKDKEFSLNVPIILDSETQNSGDINGVIGLGFLNSINLELFKDKKISLNIASYKLDKDNNEILIKFGDLFDDQKTYIQRLSYCKALSDTKELSTSNLRCKVEGMRIKNYDDALELKGVDVQFSLNQEESSFILSNKSEYRDFVEKIYFDDNKENYKLETINNTSFYCYKEDKRNKLYNYEFIINNFSYSYESESILKKSEKCPDGYYKFLVDFYGNGLNDNNTGIIFGKDFFKETQFTIDNEERIIYFFTNKVEYFSGKFLQFSDIKQKINFDPLLTSILTVTGIFVLNILAFLVYFCIKRKKEKQN